VGVKGHVILDGEVYAILPCPRREIVRAWRDSGSGVSTLVSALAHPGERLVHVGDVPPEGGTREPRRPLPPFPGSGISLEPPAPRPDL
jgi:hypothetical protein